MIATEQSITTNESKDYNEVDIQEFSWLDYLIFSASLFLPLVIGVVIYVSRFLKKIFSPPDKNPEATLDHIDHIDHIDRKSDGGDHESTERFLFGNRSMNFAAVGLSILASSMNGSLFVGMPSEVHYQGAALTIYTPISLILICPILIHIIIPRYHGMKLTSVYEYIEQRFNKIARFVAAGIFIVAMIYFLAFILYVPALVFTHVTSLSIHLTIIMTGLICTLYTAMGGMKAVVYTDTLQIIIMIIGLVTLCVLGSQRSGGVHRVLDVALQNGRLNIDNFSFDPRTRITMWNGLIGCGISLLCYLISNQMVVQRYMAVSSPGKAQLSIAITILCGVLMYVLITFVGLVVHSMYSRCDPIISRHVSAPDQIFVYFLMTTLGDYRGLPGLIVAAIFAGALSSVSSAINSLSAVFLEDIIGPIFGHLNKKDKLTDQVKQRIALVVVIIFGLVTVGLSLVADKLTSKLSQVFPTVWGAMGGPLGGMFLLGFFCPFCNARGAVIGCLGGLVIALWIAIGGFLYAPPTPSLPVGACIGNMTLVLPINWTSYSILNHHPIVELYSVSFQWFGFIGAGSTIIIGCLVSLITGGCKKKQNESSCPHSRVCEPYPKPPTKVICSHDGDDNLNNCHVRKIEKQNGIINCAYDDDDVVLKQIKRYSPDNVEVSQYQDEVF